MEETVYLREGFTLKKVGDLGADKHYPLTVPGSVYSALIDAGVLPDPYWRDNEDIALPLMEEDYSVTVTFSARLPKPEEEVLLCFPGLDTLGEITFNGTLLGKTDNMHRCWTFSVTDLLHTENTLQITLFSPLQYIRAAQEADPLAYASESMAGFVHLRKAHCMFGWDWGARLPDAGIYRPVELCYRNRRHIAEVLVRQRHENGVVTLLPTVTLSEAAVGCEYTVSLTAPDGRTVCYPHSPTEVLVENPQLWWPNGLGEQPLYTLSVQLTSGDRVLSQWECTLGLRTLTVARERDSGGESFCHEVNGVKLFAMGADYIPEDHILNRVTPARTEKLLQAAKAANFNVIRVWGGGYYPDNFFFDLCDRLGLLVWQDFMFACGVYRTNDTFLGNVRAEVQDVVRRLRHHASLALWCGNNEMEMFLADQPEQWMSDPARQRAEYLLLYEKTIPEICAHLDPDRFYWPASPSSGGNFSEPNHESRGDVHYWAVWHGGLPFRDYQNHLFRYLSEFGFQSFPPMRTIEAFTKPEDRNIFSYVMERHQRNNSANSKIMQYLGETFLYPTSLPTLVFASELLQMEALRCGVEHLRRNRGVCMGAVYWQLNDCWPVASWSSIDYFGRHKPLQSVAKRFFAPVLLSAAIEELLDYNPNAEQEKKCWSITPTLTNDTKEPVHCSVRLMLCDSKGAMQWERRWERLLAPLSVQPIESVALEAVCPWEQLIWLELWVDGALVSSGAELLLPPKHFSFKNPRLKVSANADTIEVEGDCFAKSVWIQNHDEDLVLEDNCFDMLPGKRILTVLSGNVEGLVLKSVYDIR